MTDADPDTMAVPAIVADHAPTAKLVVMVLAVEPGWISQKEIANRAELSPRAVRWALDSLSESDIPIEKRTSLSDARHREYRYCGGDNIPDK